MGMNLCDKCEHNVSGENPHIKDPPCYLIDFADFGRRIPKMVYAVGGDLVECEFFKKLPHWGEGDVEICV